MLTTRGGVTDAQTQNYGQEISTLDGEPHETTDTNEALQACTWRLIRQDTSGCRTGSWQSIVEPNPDRSRRKNRCSTWKGRPHRPSVGCGGLKRDRRCVEAAKVPKEQTEKGWETARTIPQLSNSHARRNERARRTRHCGFS